MNEFGTLSELQKCSIIGKIEKYRCRTLVFLQGLMLNDIRVVLHSIHWLCSGSAKITDLAVH